MNLVQGKGLCQLIAENDLVHQSKEDEEISKSFLIVLFVNTTDEWYSNIAHFLTYGYFPSYLSYKGKK